MVHKTVYNLFVGCFYLQKPFGTAVFGSVAEHIVHQKYVKKLTNVNHKKESKLHCLVIE